MKYLNLLIYTIFGLSLTLNTSSANSIQQVKKSVIKVYTTASAPDYTAPWQLSRPQQFSGSGTVISKQRILTNAHVVANAKYIQVQKHNDPEKYLATVSFISHAADLAVLQVANKDFFKDLQALEISDLPELYQEVSVVGYPVGGESLSITKGILSRVEQQTYAHSQRFLLAGQIDAAINPGNSGGPVVVGKKIVGVVMQAYNSNNTMNLGYFIPPSIIRHVLKDSEDQHYDGFPSLGIVTQNLENPSAKLYYGLNENQNGVLVNKVFSHGIAANILQKNDVLLSIDNYDIASNSTINYTPSIKSHYIHAVNLHHPDDKIKITYVRAGRTYTTEVIAQKNLRGFQLVKELTYDKLPKYYIYAGLVFVPLNKNLLQHLGDGKINISTPWVSPEKQEIVIISQVLTADVNLGYHNFLGGMVKELNGIPIQNFAQFTQLLQQNTAKNIIIEDEYEQQIILNHAQALASEVNILQRYNIPARHSKGLF